MFSFVNIVLLPNTLVILVKHDDEQCMSGAGGGPIKTKANQGVLHNYHACNYNPCLAMPINAISFELRSAILRSKKAQPWGFYTFVDCVMICSRSMVEDITIIGSRYTILKIIHLKTMFEKCLGIKKHKHCADCIWFLQTPLGKYINRFGNQERNLNPEQSWLLLCVCQMFTSLKLYILLPPISLSNTWIQVFIRF